MKVTLTSSVIVVTFLFTLSSSNPLESNTIELSLNRLNDLLLVRYNLRFINTLLIIPEFLSLNYNRQTNG